MAIQIDQQQEKSVIVLDSNIRIGSDAADIQNAVLDAIQSGSKIIIMDLSNLDYINSWGIGSLIHAHTTCARQNIEFYLTGVNSKILEILKRVKLHQIFTIRETAIS